MGLSFLGLGFSAALVLWSATNQRLSGRLRVVLTVVSLCVAIALVLAISDGTVLLGEGPWYQLTPYKEGLVFFAMVLGMSARSLTKAIEERRKRLRSDVRRRKRPPLDLDPWEFCYPLCISVITFGLLLQQIGSQALTIQVAILSFQTGFFWQTLLARSEAAEADPAGKGAVQKRPASE